MGLGNLRKRRTLGQGSKRSLTFQPQLEPLERRDLLAVYLPDTFAGGEAQPVGAAFNGGEQGFFAGFSGNLRFEFGQSALSTSYSTSPATNNGSVIAGPVPTWNAITMNSVLSAAADAPVGTPELYQGLSVDGSENRLNVVYRAAGGKLVHINSLASSWESKDIVASGAVSDPEAAAFNGGRQVLYIDSAGRVHFVGSADAGGTWNDTDLTALVGQGANASAKAVPTSGVAAIQVGSSEYYVYHRADGGLGYFLWNGTAWGYDVLDATDLPGYIAPFNGATGVMDAVSYSTTASANPDAGWVLYKDGAGDVRGVWLTEGGSWHSAVLTNVRTASALSTAYDPASRKLSVAYYDANSHLRLLQEGSAWTNKDYHAGAALTLPLGNLGKADTPATPATGVISLSNSTSVTITAASPGTFYNGVTVNIAILPGTPLPDSASATFDATTKSITVSVYATTTRLAVRNAIDALPEFTATTAGSVTPPETLTAGTLVTLSGATDVVPGTAARPDIYFRSFTSGTTGPSLQILYKDMSNHVHNVRPTSTSGVLFDTTAYLEGYRSAFGYGLVNAARAVAYAMGTQTVTTGAPLENWNLDLVKAPDAWSTATGQNAAVFVLDSGVDIENLDMNTLAGRNIAAQTTNVDDSYGHGTGVAGIISAKNDAGGLTGVAFDAKVVPIKIGDSSPNSEAAIVNAIDYAMNYTLPSGYATATRVLNLSLGTTQQSTSGVLPALRDKLYAESPDAVFVMAAGNRSESRADYPAAFAVGFGVVAGVINIDGKRWLPANRASTTTPTNYLMAPGVDVPTSALVGDSGNSYNQTTVSGTSAAAAHISGVIALMLDANPALTPREVECILIASADQVITLTVTGSAPSINATIYWAGGGDSGQAAAIMTGETSSAVGGDSATDTDEIPVLAASQQVMTVQNVVSGATTKAVDEVFEAVSQEEAEDLLDLFAADDSFAEDWL